MRLAPRQVLRRAAEPAPNMERTERVRRTLRARAARIAGFGVVALVGGLSALIRVLDVPGRQIRPAPPWPMAAILAVAPCAWPGFVRAVMFRRLARLERYALAEHKAPDSFSGGRPSGS